MSELTPKDVLADLLGSADFPADIFNPELEAALIIQRLRDAGFEIVPADRESAAQAMPEEPCQLTELPRL